VAAERQISVLNASKVFDFYLQDEQRYLLVIWLAWLALSDSFIMLSSEMSFVRLRKCTGSPLPDQQARIFLCAQFFERFVGQLPRIPLDADDEFLPDALESL